MQTGNELYSYLALNRPPLWFGENEIIFIELRNDYIDQASGEIITRNFGNGNAAGIVKLNIETGSKETLAYPSSSTDYAGLGFGLFETFSDENLLYFFRSDYSKDPNGEMLLSSYDLNTDMLNTSPQYQGTIGTLKKELNKKYNSEFYYSEFDQHLLYDDWYIVSVTHRDEGNSKLDIYAFANSSIEDTLTKVYSLDKYQNIFIGW